MAQPSSGTYDWAPSFADLMRTAYGRIQIRQPSFTADHMWQAVMAANLLMCDFGVVDVPNLWKVTLLSINLVQGQATYSVPKNVVAILDYYLQLPLVGDNTQTQDIVVSPISRTEYSTQPDKTLQARPTSVWWDRQINSTVTLWPTPDQNGPYVLRFYAMTQTQDVVLPQGATVDIPWRFNEAFTAGLAAKLAITYPPPPPNSIETMQALAQKAWTSAANQDVEQSPIYIIPGLSRYDGR